MSNNDASLPTPPAFPPKLNFMGGGMVLKERFRKEKITDYKLDQFMPHRGKTVVERMRELDNIKMYTPMQEEVDLLNVSPYRMDLLVKQDVMYLCGGLVGVRFSSSDLSELMRLSKEMKFIWTSLGESFKSMSAATKKLVINDTNKATTDATTTISETLTATATDAAPIEVSAEEAQVRAFHQLADNYVVHFGDLQRLIAEKQKSIDQAARTDAPSLNPDPESKMGRSLPEWLTTLIIKHQSNTAVLDSTAASKAPSSVAAVPATAEAPALPAPQAGLSAAVVPVVTSPVPSVDSSADVKAVRSSKVKVGELSMFLSGCMTGVHACSESENEALSILVQASNDTVMNVSNTDIQSATAATHSGSGSGGRCSSPTLFPGGDGTPRGRKYWARRFYAFLSTLCELKSAVKDEGALDAL